MALDRAGVDVERDHRAGVEIVAGALIAEPRRGIAGTPEREVGFGIVGAGDPDCAAAALVVIAARRPGLAAGLAGRGNGVGLPQRFTGLGIHSGNEAAHAKFAARCAEDHLTVDDEWRERHVVRLPVVVDVYSPNLLS